MTRCCRRTGSTLRRPRVPEPGPRIPKSGAAGPGAVAKPRLQVPISDDMVSHMKTTVDIPDDLLDQAKRLAKAEHTTFRVLLMEGLRWVIAKRSEAEDFQLEDRSVDGNGLQEGVADGSWEQIRDLIYRGRGA